MDSYTASLSVNSIAQNIFAQVDKVRNCHTLLSSIADFFMDGKQLMQSNAFITLKMGDAIGEQQRKDERSYFCGKMEVPRGKPCRMSKNNIPYTW